MKAIFDEVKAEIKLIWGDKGRGKLAFSGKSSKLNRDLKKEKKMACRENSGERIRRQK